MKKCVAGWVVLSLVLLACLWMVGCGGSSGSDIVGNYSGEYVAHVNGSLLSPLNSGARVTKLVITQAEDGSITVVDNNGTTYTGDLDDEKDGTVSFEFSGLLPNGEWVTVSGTLEQTPNTINISGNWVEPGKTCVVSGELKSSIPTPVAALSLTPTQITDCGGGNLCFHR